MPLATSMALFKALTIALLMSGNLHYSKIFSAFCRTVFIVHAMMKAGRTYVTVWTM